METSPSPWYAGRCKNQRGAVPCYRCLVTTDSKNLFFAKNNECVASLFDVFNWHFFNREEFRLTAVEDKIFCDKITLITYKWACENICEIGTKSGFIQMSFDMLHGQKKSFPDI
ncbi:hypothetical protein CDAR_19681 [Caerostris darwini]|uniref:Uncharacterized protein n=1 Tax=Caerostris darwini TaxID=1538125 RepID=A0AAV4QHZ4_9ARAC|nr:hypothetical protein CDAR_19681 [Caerostris darwini]